MAEVPRHEFVPAAMRPFAYANGPLPIGHGQTISQPFIVAYMTQALELTKDDRVLEVGTGSGYQAAILGKLCKEVYTIEIVPDAGAVLQAAASPVGFRECARESRATDILVGPRKLRLTQSSLPVRPIMFPNHW